MAKALGNTWGVTAAEATVAGAEVSMELSVDDYLMGRVAMFDAQTGLAHAGEFFWRSLCF